MKISFDFLKKKQEKRSEQERRWLEIYDYWMVVREEKGAVARVAKKFSCSKNTVITSISFGLKFGEYGSFKGSR